MRSLAWFGLVLQVVGAPATVLADSLDRAVAEVYASEPDVEFDVSWAGWTGDAAVLDLTGFGSEAAPVDVLRVLFRTAEALQDETISELHLAHDGEVRLVLPGHEMRDVGSGFGMGENPVYLIRTLPERLLTPSGLPAFDSWTGGMIGVLGAQMEDVNRMADVWYLDDLRAGRD